MAGRRIEVEIAGDASSLERAFNRASGAASGFGRGMQNVGARLSRSLTLPIVGAGVAAAKLAVDFEHTMSQVVGLAGQSQRQVDEWSRDLIKLGPALGKAPQELAEGLYFVASSGVRTSNVLNTLTISAKASTAGLGDTKTVADAVTSAMNAYGQKNMTAAHAADVLTATVREGKGEAAAFAPVIGNVAAVAAQLGVKFEEVGAALAAQTRLGTDAATAATQLQAVFSSLLKVTPMQTKAFEEVGLSADGLRQELAEKGLLPTLRTISDAFDGNTSAMARAFPNVRALRAVLALVGKQGKDVAGVFDRMSDSTGDASKAFEIATKTVQFKMAAAMATLRGSLITIGTILAPVIAKIAGAISDLATKFNELSPAKQKIILFAAGGVAALGPLLTIIGNLSTVIGFLAANPLAAGLLVAAGAAAILYAKVQPVHDAVNGFVGAVRDTAKELLGIEPAGVSAGAGFNEVGAGSHAATQSMVSDGTQIGQTMMAIRDSISQMAAAASAIWARFGDLITRGAQLMLQGVAGTFRLMASVLSGTMQIIAGLLTGDFGRVWDGIKTIATAGWTALRGIWDIGGKAVILVATAAGRVLSSVFTPVWSAIRSGASATWSAFVGLIKSAVGQATGAARAVGAGIVGGIKAGMSKIVAVVKGALDAIWGVIKNVAGLAYKAATAIGAEIIHGIAAGISSFIGDAISAVKRAGNAILGAAKSFFHIGSPSQLMADEVGKPLMEGIAAGIIASQGLATEAADRAAQSVKAHLMAGQILTAVRAAGQTIGLEHALAIARGVLQGSPGIVGQVRLALQQGIAAARQAIVDARSSFVSAFSQLANDALAAFDTQMAAWRPRTQVILDRMQLADQVKRANEALASAMASAEGGGAALADQLAGTIATQIGRAMSTAVRDIMGADTMAALQQTAQQAQASVAQAITAAAQPALAAAQAQVTAAQTALDAARATGDAEAIAAAQQALDTAVSNQNALEAAVRQRIEEATAQLVLAEQRRHDQIAAKQREGLARQLAELRTELLKHPTEWNTMGLAVQRILASYNVRLTAAGRLWAEKFGDGIRAGIGAAVAAAQALADAVAAVLPTTSSPLKPAKKGPLDFHPFDMGRQWNEQLAAGLNIGALHSAMSAAASPMSGDGFTGGRTVAPVAGGSINVPEKIVLEIDGRKFAEWIYRDLLLQQKHGKQLGFT